MNQSSMVRMRRDGVTVSDNGSGIAATAGDRVFEPLFTTKPAGSGHFGLGLSLAHEILVKAYGGWLASESTVRAGATFTLLAP